MRALLSSDGPLARVLPGFREREAQLRMAESVAEVLEHGGHLVCEAGTGTGKSLAYLVPAAASGRRIVVSTATKALQGQLWHADLPLAAAAIGKPIRAELLKGRSNYVCKLHAGQVEARLFDVRFADALDAHPALAADHRHRRPGRARPLPAGGALGRARRRARPLPRAALPADLGVLLGAGPPAGRARPTSCWSTTRCSSPTSACAGPRTAGSRSCPTTTRWSSTRPTPSRTRPPSGSARGSGRPT